MASGCNIPESSPWPPLVGIAADIASGAEDQALGFASIMKAVGRNFTSKTWLQGLSGVMQAMSDPDRYGDAWVNRTAATLAQPATLLSHIGRYMDPYQRETDRASLGDQLKYRLPGLRESLPQSSIPMANRSWKPNARSGVLVLSPCPPRAMTWYA